MKDRDSEWDWAMIWRDNTNPADPGGVYEWLGSGTEAETRARVVGMWPYGWPSGCVLARRPRTADWEIVDRGEG